MANRPSIGTKIGNFLRLRPFWPGRFEMFAPAWRDRTVEDDPGAPFFNETEKFVVGAQPLGEVWANTVAVGAYDPAVIRRLKSERDGVIYISGSGQLVRALLSEGLVDELHLFVYPLALGKGERFWGEGDGPYTTTASFIRPTDPRSKSTGQPKAFVVAPRV